MVAGHLQEKKGYYYIVLSYKDGEGKRKTKWLPTKLTVKGNKKRAEQMLQEARRQAGRVIWLNPIPQRNWQYIRCVQAVASVCTMVPCSTLRELAAPCRKLTIQ